MKSALAGSVYYIDAQGPDGSGRCFGILPARYTHPLDGMADMTGRKPWGLYLAGYRPQVRYATFEVFRDISLATRQCDQTTLQGDSNHPRLDYSNYLQNSRGDAAAAMLVMARTGNSDEIRVMADYMAIGLVEQAMDQLYRHGPQNQKAATSASTDFTAPALLAAADEADRRLARDRDDPGHLFNMSPGELIIAGHGAAEAAKLSPEAFRTLAYKALYAGFLSRGASLGSRIEILREAESREGTTTLEADKEWQGFILDAYDRVMRHMHGRPPADYTQMRKAGRAPAPQ